MNKIEKISILNRIKSTEESSDSTCSLKFPLHHKHQRNETIKSMNNQNISTITLDDIEKTIIKAYHQAELIMKDFKLSEKLKKKKLNDLNKLSSFVFQRLTKHSTVDYSTINNNNDDEDDSDDDCRNDVSSGVPDECLQNGSESNEDSSDEDNQDEYHLATSKQTFQGMRIFDKINPTKSSNYFQIFINIERKYILKQTAARLLNSTKNSLSSDRLLRVQQTNKQQ